VYIKKVLLSNLDNLKERSEYHFDPFDNNPAHDTIRYVGRFNGDWSKELQETIESSTEVTWRTRNPNSNRSEQEFESEEYDIKRAGGDPNHPIGNMNYDLLPVFQKMADALYLVDGERPIQSRVHTQTQGQVWSLHIDKLNKYAPKDPDSVFRFFIMLNDWEPGHFIQFGNYMHTGYKAGEIYTFDWYNVPHCTANAGLSPRSNLLVTGIATEKTYKLLANPKVISI